MGRNNGGKKLLEQNYANGKLEGMAYEWHESGEMKREAKIKDGKIIYDKQFIDGHGG
jgi:antitoxin component YwqK of YwqJK toxin-antitoxin module